MAWGNSKPKRDPDWKPSVDMVGAVYRIYHMEQHALGPVGQRKGELLAEWEAKSRASRYKLHAKLRELGLEQALDFEED